MKFLAVMLFLAGILHFALHVPAILAGGGALLLWVLWKAKWLILGFLGLEMLFGGGGRDSDL